jgi:hypothetical protein
MIRFRRPLKVFALLLGMAYAFAPVAAGLEGAGDRRGPLIYPEFYHAFLYVLAYRLTNEGDGKPRVSYFRTRPLFYGIEPGWRPRPANPSLAEQYDRERERIGH